MRKLELLSPAGDMERLEMAVAYGRSEEHTLNSSHTDISRMPSSA